MEKHVILQKLMEEYNYTAQQAQEIIEMYIYKGTYNELCDLFIAKRQLSMEFSDV